MRLQVLRLAALGMMAMASGLPAAPKGADERLPSLELLEYLGSLVESRDGLIGPEIFAQEQMIDNGGTRDETTHPGQASDEGEQNHER